MSFIEFPILYKRSCRCVYASLLLKGEVAPLSYHIPNIYWHFFLDFSREEMPRPSRAVSPNILYYVILYIIVILFLFTNVIFWLTLYDWRSPDTYIRNKRYISSYLQFILLFFSLLTLKYSCISFQNSYLFYCCQFNGTAI